MVSIEQLPVEILMNIFRYLPNYGHVSLVNKLFYNVVCSVNDVRLKLSLNQKTLVDPNHQSIMDSIVNTRRKISKVSIRFTVGRSSQLLEFAWSDILKILRKSSATIKHLKLVDVQIGKAEFLEMLSCVPKAQQLHFYNVETTHNQTNKGHLNNEFLKLDHLKTLELVECCEALLVVFNNLPAGVLENFTTGWIGDFDLLAGFFTQQSNIKNLTLGDEYEQINMMLPEHISDLLKLESFECVQSAYNSRHAKVLSKQTQLTSLKLRGYDAEIDGSILDAITNHLSELETFSANVNNNLAVPFECIAKWKKLKDLTITSCSLKIIETISELDNSRITTLNMTCIHNWTDDYDNFVHCIPQMSIDLITALAKSLPNLKVLRFQHFCECPSIAAIMKHFNFVDILEIKLAVEIDVNRLNETIDVDRCYNSNLTEFKITEYFRYDDSILTKLIEIYPNLKKLSIHASTLLTASQLKLILNGFKEMDSLELYFGRSGKSLNLTADCLDCIKDHKNSWKSIKINDVNALTAEYKEQLGAVFDVITHEYSTLYMANRKFVDSV